MTTFRILVQEPNSNRVSYKLNAKTEIGAMREGRKYASYIGSVLTIEEQGQITEDGQLGYFEIASMRVTRGKDKWVKFC